MFEKSDKSTVQQETIQDIALRVVEEQLRTLELERDSKEHTVFFVGSKGVGKTTVINNFFEREEANTRPTWALEYSYGRRSGQNQLLQKQVLNVWELGTLDNAQDLISVPININGVLNLAVVLMLDLSQPQYLSHDFDILYKAFIEIFRQKLSLKNQQDLREQTIVRLRVDSLEELSEDLLPIPLVIVGAKYDIFNNFEPELKKNVCQFIRSLAQLTGAAVLFYSHKIPKLVKTLRDTVSHLGFGSPTNPFRSHIIDSQQPLSIWFGTDTWGLINDGNDNPMTMNEIINKLNSMILQQNVDQNSNEHELIDPAKDMGFKEAIIDDMRAQKNEELNNLLREIDLRARFESVTE